MEVFLHTLSTGNAFTKKNKQMKKIFLMLSIVTAAFAQSVFAQKNTSPILVKYYALKDALVAGDVKIASQSSGELVKALDGADTKLVPSANKKTLVLEAKKIASGTDIEKQRQDFATLSTDVIALLKKSKLTDQPVYTQYCPMKKSSWVSSEKAIKNPYYGSMMLSCGKVTETL
ncbi:Protein of unknown function [bacterium A37T11]|nr:Protein of unknown function [bacterium A37T11]